MYYDVSVCNERSRFCDDSREITGAELKRLVSRYIQENKIKRRQIIIPSAIIRSRGCVMSCLQAGNTAALPRDAATDYLDELISSLVNLILNAVRYTDLNSIEDMKNSCLKLDECQYKFSADLVLLTTSAHWKSMRSVSKIMSSLMRCRYVTI